MRLGHFIRTVSFSYALAVLGTAAAAPPAMAEAFRPGVGLANPGMGINASGYVKWERATVAPFIDRMKGAFAWRGRLPSSGRGDAVIVRNVGVFSGADRPLDVTLRNNTVIDAYQLLVAVVYHRKLITTQENEKIQKSPDRFFKIERGPDGRSQLMGRLRESDPFRAVVRFDRDIGMDLRTLRRKGHLRLTRTDLSVGFGQLKLDSNGWPKMVPTDLAGQKGSVWTSVLWYPAATAKAPDSLYAGTFYLLADGEGTLSMIQRGKGTNLLNKKNIRIDGPTAVKFDFQPNGNRVDLSITDSDPRGNGEYLRNIRIIHERHMALYEAGEIFTPEYVEFMQDYRSVRWMQPMEGPRNAPYFEGRFEDRPKLSHYTFNMGSFNTPRNGFPIDAIIAFSNKTGTDPWITLPVNVSDEFTRGAAAYIAEHLDPALKVYVELGNENWNGIFPSYRYSRDAALKRWGELKVQKGAGGRLEVTQKGRFMSNKAFRQTGASSPKALAVTLGLRHPVLREGDTWYEWSSMRATQVGRIFEQVFEQADPANAKTRLVNVMGSYAAWPRAIDLLMTGSVWKQEEPDAWIDPASVFEAVAVAPYFGHYLGSRHADMVSQWIKDRGPDAARDMAMRHLRAGLDPAKPYYRLTPNKVGRAGRNNGDPAFRDVPYSEDLIIDAWPLLENWHKELHQKYRRGTGVREGKAFLGPEEAAQYLRLADESGNSVPQVKKPGGGGTFKTVLTFRGKVNRTLEQLIADGIVLPRSINSIGEEARRYINSHHRYAKKYGVDVIAYEGGQHIAIAAYGAFRANLKNGPLVKLLIGLNKEPEMAELYHYWFDAWRKANGGLFAHYSDVGMPSRYGDWGVMVYLGQDKLPSERLPKLDALRAENANGPWWREDRSPGTFLQGVIGNGEAAGTAKPDILVAGRGMKQLSAGPGDDGLFGGAQPTALDGGPGNDILVIGSAKTKAKGGPGWDTLKAARSMETLDLSTISASGIEAVDTRNASRSTLLAKPADIVRISGGNRLSVYAETADKLSLKGFKKLEQKDAAEGFVTSYQGSHSGQTVRLDVITDISPR